MSFTDSGPISPERLYTDDELCHFFTEAPRYEQIPYWNPKFFLVRFIMGTGMRVSEILQLRVHEDCLPSGVIYIRHGAKSGKPRTIRVSPELEPYYKARLRTIEPGQRLFPGITSTKTLERWWDECFAVTGIEKRKGRSCHAGRHQFCTEELNSGRLQVWQVAAQVGHKTPEITLSTYTHCLMERMYQQNRAPKWWKLALPQQHLRVVKSA